MSVNSIIVKKHLRTNKKNLILNFFSLVFSLFALVFVVVVLMNSNNLEAQILNTYPNKNVYQVSKKINITDSNMSNGLIQLNRPTENELQNVKEFKDSFFDIDLFYLFDSYEVTKDNLKQNLAITFEPYFYNDEKILYSGFEICPIFNPGLTFLPWKSLPQVSINLYFFAIFESWICNSCVWLL